MSEDDDYLKDDITNSKGKRRRLKVKDVYSDSSDEEDDGDEKGDTETKTQEPKDDNDSDMFASDDEEDGKGDATVEPSKDTKAAKGPKKLDMEQFEQEFEIENNNEQEPEFEAFDLRQEQEEGYFDDEGNFIRHDGSDNELELDHWTDLDKTEIEKAKRAKHKQQESIKNKTKQSVQPLVELLTKLIGFLEPDETPMEALSRYAPKKKSKKKSAKAQDDSGRKQAVMELTDICDKLIIHKQILDTYDMVREEFMRLYKSETGEEFKLNRGTKRQLDNEEEDSVESEPKVWQFKWEGQDEVHGPYSEYEMGYWKHNYFENQVEVKRIDETEFTHISHVNLNEPTDE